MEEEETGLDSRHVDQLLNIKAKIAVSQGKTSGSKKLMKILDEFSESEDHTVRNNNNDPFADS